MKFLIFLFVITMAIAIESNVEELLDQGNNRFTAKMFSEVIKGNPGKSAVLSAFSVLQPLAQLALASIGESHDELLNAIGLPNDNVTKALFPLLNKKLQATKGIELNMANRVYIPKYLELNDEFAVISRDVFGSEVRNVDFAMNYKVAKEINEWVESQTNKRIKNLIDPITINAETRAVLVNAIYFKGTWKYQFDKSLTNDMDFHVSKDSTINLSTMFKKDEFKYGESKNLNAKLLELEYEGGQSSFLIILPNEIEGITDLEKKLEDPSILDEDIKTMEIAEVEVYIPKFKIETTTNLKQVLYNIGIKKLFNGKTAKLEKLLKDAKGLFVSDAVQKAFIEVNEEGAEAAAANAFIITVESLNVYKQVYTFKADKPFYFEIRVNSKRLFNGVFKNT